MFSGYVSLPALSCSSPLDLRTMWSFLTPVSGAVLTMTVISNLKLVVTLRQAPAVWLLTVMTRMSLTTCTRQCYELWKIPKTEKFTCPGHATDLSHSARPSDTTKIFHQKACHVLWSAIGQYRSHRTNLTRWHQSRGCRTSGPSQWDTCPIQHLLTSSLRYLR